MTSTHVLSPEHRLRRAADFGLAVRRGRRASRPLLTVHVLGVDPSASGTDLGNGAPVPARAGLIVGKGVGGSVVRSRTARRLRHLLRSRVSALPAGSMLVIRAGASAGTASSASLAVDLDRALAAATRPRVPR